MTPHRLAALFWVLALLALPGCGERARTTAEGQERTVERERTVGTMGGERVDLVRERTQETRTRSQADTERETIPPEVPPLLSQLATAAAPLLPGGGLAAGVLGLGAAWLASRKRADAERQRDEIVDGVERAKPSLAEDQWAALTAALEAEQSRDTRKVVRSRTDNPR